jgi:hypothetical protein
LLCWGGRAFQHILVQHLLITLLSLVAVVVDQMAVAALEDY